MAKQADYFDDIDDDDAPSPPAAEPAKPATEERNILASRIQTAARISSGNVRQVVQHRVDPEDCVVWEGNPRIQGALTADDPDVRELIDSIKAEGQKDPVVARRLPAGSDKKFEIIAGSRRFFAVSWLRANNYPDTKLILNIEDLNDEQAFRLTDSENRVRKDICFVERAMHYAAALEKYYAGHQVNMAERMGMSTTALSRFIKAARVPEAIWAAFPNIKDISLRQGYALAVKLDDPEVRKAAVKQAERLSEDPVLTAGLDAPKIAEMLLTGAQKPDKGPSPAPANLYSAVSAARKPLIEVQKATKGGIVLRMHSNSGASLEEAIDKLTEALKHHHLFN